MYVVLFSSLSHFIMCNKLSSKERKRIEIDMMKIKLSFLLLVAPVFFCCVMVLRMINCRTCFVCVLCDARFSCGQALAVGPTSCWQTLSLWTWNDVYRRISTEPVNMDGYFSSASSVLRAHLWCDRILHRHTSEIRTNID